MNLLTVVVCTRNRRESCLETLASLGRQESSHFDVLVVDNGGSDGTEAAVRNLSADFAVPLRAVREEEPGLSAARNRALNEVGGTALVFLDDDVTCAPALVTSYHEAFAQPEVVAAGGRIVPRLPCDVDALVRRHAEVPYGGPCAAYDLGDEILEATRESGIPHPFGGNMAVRRDALQRLGGFRTDLGWGPSGIPGEETELFRRLAHDGGRILYLPCAEVDHRVQPEKLTREYFLGWYRSQGRAAAVMTRARSGALARLAGLSEQAFQVARYGMKRAAARTEVERFGLECKLARARGKLAGLARV